MTEQESRGCVERADQESKLHDLKSCSAQRERRGDINPVNSVYLKRYFVFLNYLLGHQRLAHYYNKIIKRKTVFITKYLDTYR